MAFPATLTNAVDGVTEIVAAHLNNLEAKVGIDNSAVPTSLDYLLKNAGSIDPGHKHTAGAFSGGNDGDVFYKTAGAWGSGTPEAAGLVTKSGDQNIAGVKNFTSIPIGPGSNPTTANQLARKAYVDLMLPLAGGAMAGNIAMDNNKVTGLAAASGTGEAVRYDEWTAAQDPGHKHSKLWASDGDPEAVTVDTAGKVGVGTASPGAKLHVSGGSVLLDNAYNLTGKDNSGTARNLVYLDGSNGLYLGDNTNTITTIRSSGNTVLRAGGAIDVLVMEGAGAAANSLYLKQGKVGIGITGPEGKLHISDASDPSLLIGRASGSAGDTAGLLFKVTTVAGYKKGGIIFERTGSSAQGSLHFATLDTDGDVSVTKNNAKLTITSAGDIGIGTTGPGKKLDVAGYARAAGIFNTRNSAPADGDLAAGECAWWFDKTDGAAKVMFKGKSANGTVVAGSLSLS
ncbi:MAG: hypothetical protein C4567_00215 [Deltaproteobacteria bacterium]|nr:MAG: hypothetical protein C4567_00215 [Deltaproteobacteria bacterium]